MNSIMIAGVIIIAILSVVVIGAFLRYSSRSKVSIKGPLGTQLEVEASNELQKQQPGISIHEATSQAGGILAEDETGFGVDINRVDVRDDIIASSKAPSSDPKA